MKQKKQDVDVVSLLQDLGNSIKNVSDRLSSLEKSKEPKGTFEEPIQYEPTQTGFPKSPSFDEDLSKYPVPTDYRLAVNEVLSPEFDVYIKPSGDSPTFQLVILVPEKYSNISGAQRQIYKVDVRSRVISLADGANGVREYAKKVLGNLGPDTQQRILADKAAKEIRVAQPAF